LLDDEAAEEKLLLELVDLCPEESDREEDSGDEAVAGESGGVREAFRWWTLMTQDDAFSGAIKEAAKELSTCRLVAPLKGGVRREASLTDVL
jgi:hypothetical protein